MMTSEEEEKVDQERKNYLLTLALREARLGSKFISGSKLRKKKDALEKKEPKPNSFQRTIIKEVPKLQDIKEIDEEAIWSGRDLLYEVGLISLVDKIIDAMHNINAPEGLLNSLKNLLEAMKNGDSMETKKKLQDLTENWGATTSTTDRQNYHLLRAMIRIIFSTYPME